MAADSVLLKHVVPGLGCLVATTLFTSPLKAVLAARRAKTLGALNPLPMVAMWANCVSWLFYACITTDPYVLASNVPGLMLATFMTLSTYGLADERMRDMMLKALLFFSVILTAAGVTMSFGGFDHATTARISGSTCVAILIIFYSAPLSVVAEVVRSRSSAALVLPFAIMNAVNGSLWTVYGLAVKDAFIWGPNLIGAVFGSIQVLLCFIFPSKPVTDKIAL